MPRVLAVDTTAELGSLAVYDGERSILNEVTLHSPDGFGHILFDRIRALLDREGVTIADIDCFASASGPGSFTGVRIGLTAVKGLADATGKAVVAVSNLQALAWFGEGPLRATVLDARRGEVYGALYDASLQAIQPERVVKFPVWLDGLPDGPIEFIGANFAPFAGAVEVSRFRGARVVDIRGTLAGAIAQIAHRELTLGQARDPAAVDANYVRRADAELFWKDA